MVKYEIVMSKRAEKDKKKLKSAGLEKKAKEIISSISDNPYIIPPPYEKLSGDLAGLYSRRINIQHRLVYDVNEYERTIRIISMWSHYENIVHEDVAEYEIHADLSEPEKDELFNLLQSKHDKTKTRNSKD